MRFQLKTSTAIYIGCFAATTGNAQVTDAAAAPKLEKVVSPASVGDNTDPLGDIVVTGSRIVTTGNQAPTPVTVLSPQRLLNTQPSNLGDALRQLPQFAAAPATASAGVGSSVSSANTLNLRQFGANRNLVLFDGNRLAPATSSGAVDTNVIPQGLIKRVDVVTGGVSAVYGSDAITGVINFIIDRNFNGLKASAQGGISNYGDDASWKSSITAGTSLFGGRGHFEASYEHYDSAGIKSTFKRREGPKVPTVTGNGTPEFPFDLIENGRSTLFVPAGALIIAPSQLAGTAFLTNGVPTEFVHGQPTSVFGLESGGDGAYYPNTLITPLTTDQSYARFDYELTDAAHVHLQGGYSASKSTFPFFGSLIFSATVRSGNPFIPASIQNTLTANNLDDLTLRYLGGFDFPGGMPDIINVEKTRNILVNPGIEGKIGWLSWKADYTFNRSVQNVTTMNNPNNLRFAAALDAVRAPDGRIVCQVSLTGAAALFPGCVPFNPFGPTAFAAGAPNFLLTDTYYKLTNDLHDVNGSISGSPLSLWAGPVGVAINAEYRKALIRNRSNADPRVPLDCTGLRPTPNCTAQTPPFNSDVLASVSASQSVREIGAEIEFPLLKGVPFVSQLDLNLAGRYTHYSVSGTVYTWKVGTTWHVIDGLRLRGTISRDIRAPTLYDLYAPISIAPGGFVDQHTNTSGVASFVTQGNTGLGPEASRTKTLGIIYQPSFLRKASFAVDYYDININNAITAVNPADPVIQALCETSGGSSPYCQLYLRPGPFSDHSTANRATTLLNQSLNVARTWTRGVDVEANYSFDPRDVVSSLPGTLNLRFLLNYQPLLRTITITSQPYSEAAGINGIPKWRANLSVNYLLDAFEATIVGRWQSSEHTTDPRSFVDLRPRIPAILYTDLYLSYHVKLNDHGLTPFLSISNVFNKAPAIIGGNPNIPGQVYPSAKGFDVIGRYFTVGVRGTF